MCLLAPLQLVGLTELLNNHSSARKLGPVAGGCVYEWLDEYWRSTTGVTGCYGPISYGQPGFNPQQCDWKAHVDCPESDLWYHSLCGYQSASFDHYTNTAWFGLVQVFPHPGRDMDIVVPRIAYDRLKRIWGEERGPRGYVWIFLVLAVLSAALAVGGLLYVRWMRRYEELERLGIKAGWWRLWHWGGSSRREGYQPIAGAHDDVEPESDKDEVQPR